MSQLETALKAKVAEINSLKEKRERVKEWLNGFIGKIVQIKSEGETFHLVFTKEGVELRKGESPSVDVTYIGEPQIIIKILDGESSAKDEIKGGNLKTWQNLHETYRFEEVCNG